MGARPLGVPARGVPARGVPARAVPARGVPARAHIRKAIEMTAVVSENPHHRVDNIVVDLDTVDRFFFECQGGEQISAATNSYNQHYGVMANGVDKIGQIEFEMLDPGKVSVEFCQNGICTSIDRQIQFAHFFV